MSHKVLLSTNASTDVVHFASLISEKVRNYFRVVIFRLDLTLCKVVGRRKVFVEHHCSVVWRSHVSHLDLLNAPDIVSLFLLLEVEDSVSLSRNLFVG